MIIFDNISHEANASKRRVRVLDEASIVIDKPRVGLVSPDGAVTTTIVEMIAGIVRPNRGRIYRQGKVSWPIGRMTQFRSPLSGRDTVRFVASLYRMDEGKADRFVRHLTDFGHHYDEPMNKWPRLLSMKLALACVLVPSFDVYLAEGSVVVPDDDFMEVWQAAFEERLAGKQFIMASDRKRYMEQFCDSAVGVRNGKFIVFDSVADAFDSMTVAPPSMNAVHRTVENMEDDEFLL